MNKKSDRHWQKLGKGDPYYGVLSHDKFKSGNIDDSRLAEFFESGEEHVEMIFSFIEQHIHPDFKPKRTLDFGCGVGRLVIPFSKRSGNVVGVDISTAMLEEAGNNCKKNGINNASFVISDDGLTRVDGRFDLIHSYIVLQHIPLKRGKSIIKGLINSLEKGGVGVLHVTYHWRVPFYRRLVNWAENNLPGFYVLVNLVKGRRPLTPIMQMNNYSLNELFVEIQQVSKNLHCVFTDHSGHLGIILFFKV